MISTGPGELGKTSPAKLGKYSLLEKIGHGAMGDVYKARDEVLNRPVAVKTVADASAFTDGELLRSFRREAQAVAGLNHPNIVTVFDFGESDGRLYLVLELLEGADLQTVIRERRLESLRERLELLRRIADGMAYAHARGFVHRDLKPANIRVLPDGTPKILDFGLARTREAEATYAGLVVGTPHYMSPEQIRNERIDSRSDVFSLGVLFYEVLTWRRPFPATDLQGVLRQILEDEPDPPSSWDPTLPSSVDEVLSRALAKDAERRYRDAIELRAALGEIDPEARENTAATGSLAATQPVLPAATLAAVRPSRRLGASSVSSSLLAAAPIRVLFRLEDDGDREIQLRDPRMPLLELSLASGIPHYHECGGRARCSSCRIRVLSGVENLLPRTSAEERLARRLGWTDDVRLACQTRVRGPVEVKRLIHDTQDLGLMLPEELAPQEVALAVLSCELVDFEEKRESLPPYDLFHILNRFFLQVGDAAILSGGRLVGYSDAGFRAFFGLDGGSAREKCLAAARAAVRAAVRMDGFSAYTAKFFSTEFQLGVALDYTRAIVGHLGHPSKTEITTQGSAARSDGHFAAVHRRHDTTVLATEGFVNVVEEELELGRVLADEQVDEGSQTLYEVLDLSRPDAGFIVQKTFEICEAQGARLAEIFFELLFELAPEVEELLAGVEPPDRHRRMMEELSTIVRGLGDFESLVPRLRELGREHTSHGAELHHYELVEHALIETVQRMIGDEFTDEVRHAWTKVYNTVVQRMTEAVMG